MSSIPPMAFTWDGEAMFPRHPRLADKHFVVGQSYILEERQDRSSASHNHYFAALHEAWQNLPEEAAERFPSPDHLRAFALIRCGYRNEVSHPCPSRAEALRLRAFVAQMNEFAIVTTQEAVVTVWTAKSQSMRAMGKRDFQQSKDKVLDFVAGLIGTTRDALAENAGKAA